MTAGYQAPQCKCGHAVGEHNPGAASFPHPPRYGVCRVPGCGCREFRDRNDETTEKAA